MEENHSLQQYSEILDLLVQAFSSCLTETTNQRYHLKNFTSAFIICKKPFNPEQAFAACFEPRVFGIFLQIIKRLQALVSSKSIFCVLFLVQLKI